MDEPILQRMLAAIEERSLLPPTGGVVIVGYSGGADSTALLHLLTRVQDSLNIQLHAAHLHHGMRPEADADVQVCQAVCQQLGVPLHVERVDVPALAQAQRISHEEAGRNARYAFFERLACQIDAVAVALAHTRDDQIETILINLLRGTGPRGLCGMPYKRDRIIRPLLDATREQTHHYCAVQNLPTVFDSTNLDPHQLRRRVRAELVPLLRDLSPAFDKHLLRLAAILEREEAWWEAFLTSFSSPLSVNGEEGQLLRASFASLHPALQRRVLREWLRPHLGTLHLPPFETLEAIREAALCGARASWQLSPTLRLTTDENALTLHPNAPEPVSYEYPVPLNAPIFIPEAGVWLEIRSTDSPVRAPAPPSGTDSPVRAHFSSLCTDKTVRATSAHLDADAVQGTLIVRNARRGERFQPLGMPAPKKLSDIFIDRKIPKAERWRLPLLCDEAGVLWIPGYTIAERAKITPQTQRVLQVRLYRNADET
ncbi:MAG: tRNA lysidine(34) synthetase TilS [Fimbriimonadales bacterium]|nr:tRNA lysidine(34) synthetase TilS [Fimbriimonadales bacterium]